MRNLTCCSYVSLIVDTRNITGRGPPGNAWVLLSSAATAGVTSLLATRGRLPGELGVRERLFARESFGDIAPPRYDGFRRRPGYGHPYRVAGNCRSVVVRRSILLQPAIVTGGVVRRNAVAFVNWNFAMWIPGGRVNCTAGTVFDAHHNCSGL
jgi:hypothetical protein